MLCNAATNKDGSTSPHLDRMPDCSGVSVLHHVQLDCQAKTAAAQTARAYFHLIITRKMNPTCVEHAANFGVTNTFTIAICGRQLQVGPAVGAGDSKPALQIAGYGHSKNPPPSFTTRRRDGNGIKRSRWPSQVPASQAAHSVSASLSESTAEPNACFGATTSPVGATSSECGNLANMDDPPLAATLPTGLAVYVYAIARMNRGGARFLNGSCFTSAHTAGDWACSWAHCTMYAQHTPTRPHQPQRRIEQRKASHHVPCCGPTWPRLQSSMR